MNKHLKKATRIRICYLKQSNIYKRAFFFYGYIKLHLHKNISEKKKKKENGLNGF